MKHLPEELIACVFHFLYVANALSAPMLVCRNWYLHGARNLHHTITLNLKPGLSLNSSEIAISIMKRLVSPTLSTAHLIHHLTLSGFAPLDTQELVLNILGRTTALRSLDMHALHLVQGGMLLPPDIFSLDTFLPNLSAINVTSAQFCLSLAQTRPLQTVRIHETLDDTLIRRLSPPTGSLANSVQALELALSTDSGAAALSHMTYLVTSLANAPLHALALQFVQDRPMAWTEFERVVGEMGSSLRSLQKLRTLSIVIRPDPMIPVTVGGISETGDQYREGVTRQLAERLISEGGLSRLERIELRWHGWIITEGEWEALPRTQLLRLPQTWLHHADQR